MLVEIDEQTVPAVFPVALAPQIDLAELDRAQPAPRQPVAAVRPRLGIEERTVDRSDPSGPALDEPRRPVVMRGFRIPDGDDVADTKFCQPVYPQRASTSRAASVISAVERTPFSTRMCSIDADQRS